MTSAERTLPFVHGFRGLTSPARPPTLTPNQAPFKSEILKMLTDETNPVGALQERYPYRSLTPTYQLIQTVGASYRPTFTYQVFLADLVAWGSGSSKKLAKQAAARAMLDLLDGKKRSPLLRAPASSPTVSIATKVDGIKGEFVVGNPVGLLQEFSVKLGLPMPAYYLGLVKGQAHQWNFSIVCKLGGVTFEGLGFSKKEAKRKSALKMLNYLSAAPEEDRALVFSTAAKTKVEESAGGDEMAELGKAVQQLSLGDNAAKNRWVSTFVIFLQTSIRQFAMVVVRALFVPVLL